MFTVHRNILIDFPSWDNPLFSIVVLTGPCCLTAEMWHISDGKGGRTRLSEECQADWPILIKRWNSSLFLCNLPTSAAQTSVWNPVAVSEPLTPQETLKGTLFSIARCNWNSKQRVARLSSLVTSTYFIMCLDSFIMGAVWLIFAPWCPPNVLGHGQNTNGFFVP